MRSSEGPMAVQMRMRAGIAVALLVVSVVSVGLAERSAFSATARIGLPPVTAVVVSTTPSSVSLKWTNPSVHTFTGVLIRRSEGSFAPASTRAGAFVAEVVAPTNSFTDVSVAAAAKYSYALFAIDGHSFARAATTTAKTRVETLHGTHRFSGSGYDFRSPYGIATDGSHIWVSNAFGASVTELNERDGSWIRTLSGGSYGFDGPSGIVFDGNDIWVTNYFGNSVTEVNPKTGAWVRTLSGAPYDFEGPYNIAFDGTHLWVTNTEGNSVTEIDPSTGSRVRTLSGGSFAFDAPWGLTVAGRYLWVANWKGNSATEVSTSSGRWVRTISGHRYGFDAPIQIGYDGTDLWVTNSMSDSVTEINATTGQWIRTLTSHAYYKNPFGVAFDGTNIWVTAGNSAVSEIDPKNGSRLRTLRRSPLLFRGPLTIGCFGSLLWLDDFEGRAITEFSPND
jgi:YVTN family beta-propeller protein